MEIGVCSGGLPAIGGFPRSDRPLFLAGYGELMKVFPGLEKQSANCNLVLTK